MGPDGRVRAKADFSAESAPFPSPEISNDGFLTDLEISVARERLEEVLNGKACGYGGPLGLGGWGGINELCVQPWNMGGPAREKTPDGYSMKVKLALVEEYRERLGYIFHAPKQTQPQEVEVTIRWEHGKIRLYQCEPLVYIPPAPQPPIPELIPELKRTGNLLVSGIRDYLKEAPVQTASILDGMFSLVNFAFSYFDSPLSGDQDAVAKNP
jgi:hypothetical protein